MRASLRAHVTGWGWFWAWALLGFAAALGAVSLGVLLLEPVLVAGVTSARESARKPARMGFVRVEDIG